MKKSLLFIIISMAILLAGADAFAQDIKNSNHDSFAWNKATVYFLITDRFSNGDPSNDQNYGRRNDYGSEQLNAATFHGGDFAGILEKAREGYFQKLGVDVVWMTDVYEQIHGWMTGSGAINDFPHYGYHGYYPLDYTQIDKNYGTVEEFRTLVDTLHAQGIRVMLGANLNNPGYPTLLDAVQYGFADTSLTEYEAVEHIRTWSYDQFFADRLQWNGWYDSSWVRMPGEDWDESNPLEATVFGMADYKEESTDKVCIPEFLKRKWKGEGKDNDKWVNPSSRKLRKDRDWTPSDYIIAWTAAWVEEFGIDGFRCDIVENVHIDRWNKLNEACNTALERWRESHPELQAAQWDEPFYMTGDYDHATIGYKADYANAGFMSLVNFYFPKRGDLDSIVYLWQAYSDAIDAHPNWHPFNYLNNSYHRDADMDNMVDCATTLLLSPGIAQIFYGDETLRGLSDARFNVDSDQAFRSDMNWESIDNRTLEHFRRLGTIRRNHPALISGKQEILDTHTCVRYEGTDKYIIRLHPEERPTIAVTPYFNDGDELVELYTGCRAIVVDGCITLPQYENHIAVLAGVQQ